VLPPDATAAFLGVLLHAALFDPAAGPQLRELAQARPSTPDSPASPGRRAIRPCAPPSLSPY